MSQRSHHERGAYNRHAPVLLLPAAGARYSILAVWWDWRAQLVRLSLSLQAPPPAAFNELALVSSSSSSAPPEFIEV